MYPQPSPVLCVSMSSSLFLFCFAGLATQIIAMLCPGKSHRKGRLCTFDLLALTSLDKMLLIMKTVSSVFKKQD